MLCFIADSPFRIPCQSFKRFDFRPSLYISVGIDIFLEVFRFSNSDHVFIIRLKRICFRSITFYSRTIVRQPRHISRCLRNSGKICVRISLTRLLAITTRTGEIHTDLHPIVYLRSQIQRGIITLIFLSFHRTRLIHHTQRSIIRGLAYRPRDIYVMLLYKSRVEHIIKPVETRIFLRVCRVCISIDHFLRIAFRNRGTGIFLRHIEILHICRRIPNQVQ